MTSPRSEHTATLLANGTVLIAGGFDDKGTTLSSAEIYDPMTRSFTLIGPMIHPRRDHTAILMPNGNVLIAGGWDAQQNPVNTTEIYNSSGFSEGPPMNEARAYLSSSLLAGGRVLVAGGDANESAEVYSNGNFTELDTSNFTAGAANAAATIANGDVLVTGGSKPVDKVFGYTSSDSSANLFISDGSGLVQVGFMEQARTGHTATGLPDGTLLVVGGEDVQAQPTFDELYDSANNTSSNIQQGLGLVGHTATLFTTGPDAGSVLIAGGSVGPLNTMSQVTCQSQAVTPYSNEWIYNPMNQGINPGYTVTHVLSTPRYMHTATLLMNETDPQLNGTVLVTGGIDEGGNVLNVAEIYDPTNDIWSPVPNPMQAARQSHAAALLSDGTVLIAGGCGSSGEPLASAEIYDPNTQKFTKIPDMKSARQSFTLTALQMNSQTIVLAAGGSGNTSAEFYDPSEGQFVATGPMLDILFGPTATLLASGNVLITSGGSTNAELYDPTLNKFSLAGLMIVNRSVDAAAPLPNGNVLVIGGFVNSSPVTTSTTEIYVK